MREAHDQLMAFMKDQVAKRKMEIQSQDADVGDKRDAFTMLVRANESESKKLQLNDEELVCPFPFR